jgi:hypothetical protein
MPIKSRFTLALLFEDGTVAPGSGYPMRLRRSSPSLLQAKKAFKALDTREAGSVTLTEFKINELATKVRSGVLHARNHH